jgi:CRP-like cAMP-binding protein
VVSSPRQTTQSSSWRASARRLAPGVDGCPGKASRMGSTGKGQMMDVQQFDRLPTSRARPASSPLAGSRLWNSRFMTREDQQALSNAVSPPRAVAPNVDLIREGARADSLFIVVEGWACRYATTRSGARQLPALLVPGDIPNIDTLMLDRLHNGVRTLTAATVVALPRERALALAAEHPGIARTFTWLAIVENACLSRWALSLGRQSAKERLAHLLCELSVRLDAEEEGESSFPFPLTQEHIADALGLTPVHVNRTIQQLRCEGMVVSAHRTMTLPNVAALRRIGGFDPGYLHLEPPAAARLT